jgi:hypothetical protein
MSIETLGMDSTTEEAEASRADLERSAAEVGAFYGSSLGVRAQGYEPHGDSTTIGDFDTSIVRELDLASSQRRPTLLVIHERVRATLSATPAEARMVLEQVYVPFGSGFVPSRTQAEEIAKERARLWSKDRDAAKSFAPDFLSMELKPRWGGGSFVRLSLTLPRVAREFEKRWPDRPMAHGALLDFLVFEAGDKKKSASLFRGLREDCENRRSHALEAYDVLRKERVVKEVDERRKARAKAEQESAALFEQTIEAKSHRARNRLAKLRDLDAIAISTTIYLDTRET